MIKVFHHPEARGETWEVTVRTLGFEITSMLSLDVQ